MSAQPGTDGTRAGELLQQLNRPTDPGDLMPDGPAWVCIVGPVGSGKSTLLRMLAREVASKRPVVALQLQPDLSAGYASVGAREYFDETDFKTHVEQLSSADPEDRPLLIVDGVGPDDARRLGRWVRGLPRSASLQLICATNWDDVTMSADWGAAAVMLRVDARRIPGLATGTIRRHPDREATYWEMPLLTHPQLDDSERNSR